MGHRASTYPWGREVVVELDLPVTEAVADPALSGGGLWGRIGCDPVHHHPSPSDGQEALPEVDVLPVQAAQLAAAHARGEGKRPEWIETVVGRGFEEAAELFGGPHLALRRRRGAWKVVSCAICRVAGEETPAFTIRTRPTPPVIVEHLTYDAFDDRFDSAIFTENQTAQDFSKAGAKLKKHVYDYVGTDSKIERDFVTELDTSHEVTVYAKLPRGFFIPTPVGDYNPDWAIAFIEGSVKHVYLVAETKGSLSTLWLKRVEDAKSSALASSSPRSARRTARTSPTTSSPTIPS